MKDYEALSKKHFDGQAAEYDQRDTYYYSQNGKISCRDIAAKVNSVPYEALLDVGCGTGFLIDILAKQKSARYCGVDLSDGMIRVAKSKKIPDAEFTVGSADRLPYPDESFDIVACSQSFHHYPYPEKAMLEADLLVFTSPVYVYHATGALKNMLDHFGYRWMPHRPAKEMFGKRAVIITQCLGGGDSSTAKDIKDSLNWWGVSNVTTLKFKLMSEIRWDRIPEKKRAAITSKLEGAAHRLAAVDYSKRAHTSIVEKAKFYMVRMLQTGLGKENPEYRDFNYWKDNGWLGKERPWN